MHKNHADTHPGLQLVVMSNIRMGKKVISECDCEHFTVPGAWFMVLDERGLRKVARGKKQKTNKKTGTWGYSTGVKGYRNQTGKASPRLCPIFICPGLVISPPPPLCRGVSAGFYALEPLPPVHFPSYHAVHQNELQLVLVKSLVAVFVISSPDVAGDGSCDPSICVPVTRIGQQRAFIIQ